MSYFTVIPCLPPRNPTQKSGIKEHDSMPCLPPRNPTQKSEIKEHYSMLALGKTSVRNSCSNSLELPLSLPEPDMSDEEGSENPANSGKI